MKAVLENVYARGKRKRLYVRRRIPVAIRAAYPANQVHIVRSLGTLDMSAAKVVVRAELVRIELKRQKLDLARRSKPSNASPS